MSTDLRLLPEIPEALRQAAQRGALVPFVGAGASRLAGCPGWVDFADGALEFFARTGQLSDDALQQFKSLNPKVKLAIARSLERQHSRDIDFEAILHPPGWEANRTGQRIYSALAQLATVFVTTNFDRWLDEPVALPALGAAVSTSGSTTSGSKPSVVWRAEQLTSSLLTGRPAVLHLHGSLAAPASMIMTTREYLSHYANDRAGDPENTVLTFLGHLFSTKSVLFVGYGLDELEILEYVVMKSRHHGSPSESRHFILQGFESREAPLLAALDSYYAECGVQLIPFLRDTKGWEQLADVVEHFARELPATTPLVLEKKRDMEHLLDD